MSFYISPMEKWRSGGLKYSCVFRRFLGNFQMIRWLVRVKRFHCNVHILTEIEMSEIFNLFPSTWWSAGEWEGNIFSCVRNEEGQISRFLTVTWRNVDRQSQHSAADIEAAGWNIPENVISRFAKLSCWQEAPVPLIWIMQKSRDN